MRVLKQLIQRNGALLFIPLCIVAFVPGFSHGQELFENWEAGIDTLKWHVFGSPSPIIKAGVGWMQSNAVDPNGGGNCLSGLMHKTPISWGLGSRLSMRFMTNACCIGCCIDTRTFPSHPIWDGVTAIQGNLNEGNIITSGLAYPIATHNGVNMAAVYEGEGGRIAWDATYYRFTDDNVHPDVSVLHCDNMNYVRNLVRWLSGGSPKAGDSVLVYATADTNRAPYVRSWGYDEQLKSLLEQEGFYVTVTDRATIPALTAAVLAPYDQLWFISAPMTGILSAQEVQAITDFHERGKGLMIIGDSWPYDFPANQISSQWGVTYSGEYDICGTKCGARGDYWQNIMIGLVKGIQTEGICAGQEVIVELRSVIQISQQEGGPRITLDAIGYPNGIFQFAYDPAQDNIWHEVSLNAIEDGRISIVLDDVVLGTTPDPVVVDTSLYVYVAGRSVGVTNLIDDVTYERTAILLSSSNISFGTVTVGDSESRRLWIANNLPKDVKVSRVYFTPDSNAYCLSPSDLDALSHGLVLPHNSLYTFTLQFAPPAFGTREVFVDTMNVVTDASANPFRVYLKGRKRAVTLEWSTYIYSTRQEVDEHEGITLLVDTGDSVKVDSVTAQYAPGGSRSYRSTTLNLVKEDAQHSEYSGVIRASCCGSRGLSFYLSARNGNARIDVPSSDNPVRFRVWCNDLAFPRPLSGSEYAIISVPIQLDSTVSWMLSDELGPPNTSRWRMYTYYHSGNHYAEVPNDSASTFELGKGYWIISRAPTYLNIRPCRGLSTPVDTPFVLRLDPGWNMIGNPYDFRVAWDSILVNGLKMARAESILVEPPVAYAAGAGYRYDQKVLEPFEGYWVKNLSDSAVILKIPPWEFSPAVSLSDTSGLAAPSKPAAFGSSWWIEIHASSCGAVDFDNVVGTAKGAQSAWDKHDRSEPPMAPGRALSLYFPHQSWDKHKDNYAADIRGAYEALPSPELKLAQSSEDLWGHIWRFDVAKNFTDEGMGDEVRLEFVGIENAPAGASVFLVDRDLRSVVDLRKANSYTYHLGERPPVSEAEARFMLIVGSKDFVDESKDELAGPPTRTALHQNYPNPFNPSTIIRYDLARACSVRLAVFDARGALVKVLYDGRRQPGRYEEAWDGRNERGRQVSTGIYFSRLETSGEIKQTRKMLLLR